MILSLYACVASLSYQTPMRARVIDEFRSAHIENLGQRMISDGHTVDERAHRNQVSELVSHDHPPQH